LLSTEPGSIGFVPSTTDGIGAMLNGIDWRPGDNLAHPANDFPGIVYACAGLARRGVEVRAVPVDGHLDLDRLLERIDRRTRAVVVSHVHWQTGHRVDLARLGAACRAVGALSIVDAIQSLGAIPLEPALAGIDVLVAGAYKWLLGISGVAVLWVGPRALAELMPDRWGWAGMRTSVYDDPRPEFAPDATRFQVGGAPDPVLITLERSLELLLEAGPARIESHVSALLDRLLAGLPDAGLLPRSDLRPEHRSTVLSVTTGDRDRDDRLCRRLVERGVIVARRGPGIRVSPHLHNRPADIDRLLETAAAARPELG
jgi:selenocysteine lyase/cysteine desulfurase